MGKLELSEQEEKLIAQVFFFMEAKYLEATNPQLDKTIRPQFQALYYKIKESYPTMGN